MMNKFGKFLLSLSIFLGVAQFVFATETAVGIFEIPKSSTSTVSIYGFKAGGRIVGNGVNHNAITAISSIDRFLNAKVRVNFSTAENVKIKLKYYTGNDTSNVIEVEKDNIYHNTPFYISTNIDAGVNVIHYQLEALFTYRDATERTKTSTTTYYWPFDSNDDYNSWQKAEVTSSTSSAVDGSKGGTIILVSGDQSKTDTSLVIAKGAFTETKNFTIEELSVDDYIAPANAPANTSVKVVNPNKPIKLFKVTGDSFEDVTLNISYPGMTSRDNFTLKTGTSESTITEIVPITSVDTNGKIVSAKINKSGFYALFTDVVLVDSDYRPAKRVIVKARIAQSGGGFKFDHLKDGDTVKIYNVNGKKIRTIRSGTEDGFTWDGKNDSGQYVESGTYIYQIKVKDRSKVISGTIAFVK